MALQPLPVYLAQAASLVWLILLVATAWRAYRLSGARPLAYFAGAFACFAASQGLVLALEWLTWSADHIRADRLDHFDLLFWGYYGLQILGSGLLLATFDRRKYKWVLAAGPILLVAGPLLQVTLLLLLFLVVIHAGLNHIERARIGSLRTATGFFLVLIAHFLFLFDYEPLSPRNLIGELVALAGFVTLWLAASRPHKAED